MSSSHLLLNQLFERMTAFQSRLFYGHNHRTKPGKRSLDHVETDKDGQPDPILMMPLCQDHAEQHHHSCKHQYKLIKIHDILPFIVGVLKRRFDTPADCIVRFSLGLHSPFSHGLLFVLVAGFLEQVIIFK